MFLNDFQFLYQIIKRIYKFYVLCLYKFIVSNIIFDVSMDENNREYTNGEITVYWRPKECIHATTCFRELRAVFDPGKRPWVNMQGATTDEIIRIVDLCPTSALTYKWNKDLTPGQKAEIDDKPESLPSAAISPVSVVEIRVMPDGPLVVKGEFITIGTNGKEMKKMKITSFCRCGQSQNMPYCDGNHRKVGFYSR
jgi:uncharacterized Fe-S cluster protein YjdI